MIAVPPEQDKDLSAEPMPFLWAWGVPMFILVATNFVGDYVPVNIIVLVIVASFIWMGMACVWNAKRCRRRHCYYSGPIFLLGAMASLLVGFRLVDFGADGLSIVIGMTILAALSTYGSEFIWGRYVGPK
jgi:hypothetical protein